MRIEATKEEWEKLYEQGIQFKKSKLWKKFCNDNIFSVEPEAGDAAYYYIEQIDGACEGLSLYFGLEGFNCLLGAAEREMLCIMEDYMAAQQNRLCMVFGDKEDVPFEQYERIRELGLKFRGSGNWIYFEAYEKGFFPYLPSGEEVRLFTEYLGKLMEAAEFYQQGNFRPFAEKREVFCYFSKDGEWQGEFREPPCMEYQCQKFYLEDEIKRKYMQRQKKTQDVLEIDCFCLKDTAYSEEYDKPVWPRVMILVEQGFGIVVKQRLFEPEEEEASGAQLFIDYITESGRPREVIVPNKLVGAIVEDICQKCGIKLSYGKVEGCWEAEQAMFAELREFPGYMVDNPEDILRLLGEAGVDIERMIENAGQMSEEEFCESMLDEIERAISNMGLSDMLDEIEDAFAPEEEYADFPEPFEIYDLKNRKQKVAVVKEFFEARRDGEVSIGSGGRWIEAVPSERAWKNTLKETRKERLVEIAGRAGAAVDRADSKDMVISAIISIAMKKKANIQKCLTKEENKLMRELCRKAEQLEGDIDLEDFPYSLENVLRLLDVGLIDVKYITNGYDQILQLLPLDEVAVFWRR